MEEGDWRRSNPRFQGENFYRNVEIAKRFQQLAAKKGVLASQLVLAWILAQGNEFFVIPGTTKAQNVVGNFDAGKVVLSPGEVREIRKLCNEIQAAGERYDPKSMMRVNL